MKVEEPAFLGILTIMNITNLANHSDRHDIADLLTVVTDPVERLLLTGVAATVFEAETRYLDSAFDEVLRLLQSPLSDEELGNHPLMVLFRSHGSPPREDALL